MTTRFNLTEEEIRSAIDEDASYDQKIPILQRRAEAEGVNAPKDPICVIVVGMAGSGKTTLMAQLQKSLGLKGRGEGGDGGVEDVSVKFSFFLLFALMLSRELLPTDTLSLLKWLRIPTTKRMHTILRQ